MSLERRIADLERSFGTDSDAGEDSEERRRIIKELEACRASLEEKMAREEASEASNFARRRAVEEVEAYVKRRIAERGARRGA